MSQVASASGKALGVVFGALASVRGRKPLHPRGEVVPAVLTRHGGQDWDVAWLDEPGTHECRVRLSRSVGLPSPLPDVLGLAIQFRDPDGDHDLLLASSATPPVLRHLLLPSVDPKTSTFSSVFTYSTPRGPIVLSARPVGTDGRAYELAASRPLGQWQAFGLLALAEHGSDARIDFDPVLHSLPGLALSAPLAALRKPSYAAARRRRPDNRLP